MVSFEGKFGRKIGTVVGLGRHWNELKVVVSFSQKEESPFSGEFLIVEELEGRRRKLLCFVEDPVYGDFTTTPEHREKVLVEKYLRELEDIDTPLSEEEKKSLFFRCYYVRVIGEIAEKNEDTYEIKPVYRFLPELTSRCRYPSEKEYRAIVSGGMNNNPEDMLYIGNFAVGDDVCPNLFIGIEKSKILHVERGSDGIVEKTNGKRTAILARTGYGKSNLCKVLLMSLIAKTNFPSLICDLNGEYAASSVQGRGFLDIPSISNRIVVYTEREDLIEKYPYNCFPLTFDFKYLSGRDVATLISFKETETAGLKQLRSISKDEWEQVIIEYENAANKGYSDRRAAIEDALQDILGDGKNVQSTVRALSWRLIDVLDSWHSQGGRLIADEVFFLLANGFTVILDFSLKDVASGLSVMSFLADKIMQNNIRAFAGKRDEILPCILIVEEAQNVLSSGIKEEGRDIFIKVAKEGRKFGISLIYITQQPGSIDESILSQTDNFFVMHLLNEEDINALRKANFHYSGCIANFLRNEALVGNVYIYSAPYQPYVFPARAFEFDAMAESITQSIRRKLSLRKIIEEAQNKLKGQKLLHVNDEQKYIKIGALQYLWNDIMLRPECFEYQSNGAKKLKYRHARALLKFIYGLAHFQSIETEDKRNTECWLIRTEEDEEQITELGLEQVTKKK